MRLRAPGMVLRISPIPGITPKSALAGQIWLPAVIAPFTIDETALHNEYDTLSAGHFSQPQQGPSSARQFRTASIDTMTLDFGGAHVGESPYYLTAVAQDQYQLRARVYDILRSRKAVHLLGTFWPAPDPHPELDMYATLRDVSKDVRGGERDVRYLTVQVSEWRDPSTARRKANPGGFHGRLPATRVLTATDTLHSLSYYYYGTYEPWSFIRDANGISRRWGQKTPLVKLARYKVGSKLKIPVLAVGEPAGAPGNSARRR